SLKIDVEDALNRIEKIEKSKLSYKEKGQLKKDKNECQTKLEYLYLTKDYLSNLVKYATGIALNQEQVSLIVKIAPYFDGVHVLDIEYGYEDGDDDDDSLLGAFKETADEFKSIFVGSKNNKQTTFYLS